MGTWAGLRRVPGARHTSIGKRTSGEVSAAMRAYGGVRADGRAAFAWPRSSYHAVRYLRPDQPPASTGPGGTPGLRMKKMSGAHRIQMTAIASVASA